MALVKSFLQLIHDLLPRRLRHSIWRTKLRIRSMITDPALVRAARRKRRDMICRLQALEQVSISFVVFRTSMWKYDTLYRLLDAHPRFLPSIVVVPEADLPEQEALSLYRQTIAELSATDTYRLIGAAGADSNIAPPQAEILFYTTPYDSLLPAAYHVRNNLDRYTCYANYGYTLENKRCWYDEVNHRLFHTFFVATDEIAYRYRRYMGATADNAVVVGPAIYDELQTELATAKKHPHQLPLVIVAPHHSIEPWGFALSNFLELSDFYLSLPTKYAGRLQFAFKPHPHLKQKLENRSDWGKERTKAYYQFWAEAPDCSLELGSYTRLFAHSTAMIHDCSAFSVEYLLTGHSALFIRRKGHLPRQLNTVARSAFALHTLADTSAEILVFLDQIAENTFPIRSPHLYQSFLQAALPLGITSVSEAMLHHLATTLAPKD